MLHKSKIGVCLDYSIAYLLEEKNEERVITIIEANDEPTVLARPQNRRKHAKDHVFFKKVFDIVKDFDKVLLFGPASVKKELLNRIKANKSLEIEVQNDTQQEKVTENEKIEFINSYFEN